MDDLASILQLAQHAATSSSEILLRRFGHVVAHEKGAHNLVTQADIESEEHIKDLIETSFPGHHLLREEGASTGKGDEEHLWIVDPLDATNNYAHGIPHFAVSIAYAQRGEVKVSAILDPMRRELFTAIRGKGAFLNGEAIHVSTTPLVAEGIFATGFFYERGNIMEQTLNSVRSLFRYGMRGMRRFGSAALDLAYVACGRFDGFFEYRLGTWDYAAGWLLIEEAGGRCMDRHGRPLSLHSANILGANPVVFEEFLRIVRWPDTAPLETR